MRKLIDLTGKRFERLIVIERKQPGPRNRKYLIWLCKCNCGNEVIVNEGDLIRGHTKSCGCLKKEISKSGDIRRLKPGLANMRAMIGSYKKSAKKRKIEYKLTDEQLVEIARKDCYYCGAKPNNISKHPGSNGEYIYNGLDRVNNSKGYITDNIVPCCKDCNRSKYKRTEQEYQDWIKRSYNKMFKKKGD